MSGLVSAAAVLTATSFEGQNMTVLLAMIAFATTSFKLIIVKAERANINSETNDLDDETDTSAGRRLTPPAERTRQTPLVCGPIRRGSADRHVDVDLRRVELFSVKVIEDSVSVRLGVGYV